MLERRVTCTNTDIVNKHIEEVAKLYFEGLCVKEAIKRVRATKVKEKAALQSNLKEKNH